jgi:hypothetical protein
VWETSGNLTQSREGWVWPGRGTGREGALELRVFLFSKRKLFLYFSL